MIGLILFFVFIFVGIFMVAAVGIAVYGALLPLTPAGREKLKLEREEQEMYLKAARAKLLREYAEAQAAEDQLKELKEKGQ
jgi:hypothetical protein